jgi:metal-responsive CopG/Arc/MetJ family transcriptional regulator
MQRYKATGLSIPTELLYKIDAERGDVSRSRFLLRLLEKAYEEKQNKEI